MTTLGIIGGGIAGRSILYTLAKEAHSYSKILLFSSDDFSFPCSLHSTAIVAPRGITSGHSALGDLLAEGFTNFKTHIEQDRPQGVEVLTQVTGALTKLEAFKLRYPHGSEEFFFEGILFKEPVYIAQEMAFHIHPKIYLKWLLDQSLAALPLECVQQFVTEISGDETLTLKTHDEKSYEVDKLIIAGGASSRYWKSLFPHSKLESSKAIQGSYLHFENVDMHTDSFSLTLEGDNLIYSNVDNSLLMGSTTLEANHVISPPHELKALYERLKAHIQWKFPDFQSGLIKVAHREKASKREPYMIKNHNRVAVGGFYKNGFNLGLTMAQKVLNELHARG